MQKFPQRTIVLMVLALIAFGFFFTNMQRRAQKPAAAQPNVQPVMLLAPTGGDK